MKNICPSCDGEKDIRSRWCAKCRMTKDNPNRYQIRVNVLGRNPKNECRCGGLKCITSALCQKCRMTVSPPRRPSRGWHINSGGYVVRCRYAKRELLHRVLMEQEIGRKLSIFEIVHHKNHDCSDNRMANLELMSCADHTRLHNLEKSSSHGKDGRFV